MQFLLIILAILPGLIITFLIYKLDRYEKEDKLPMALCFILGVIATLPIIYFEKINIADSINQPDNLLYSIIYAFLYIAFIEETSKFLILMVYPYQKTFFNEPFDGIVYAVVIAMGFATLENLLYAFRFNIDAILIRAFTAIPAHASFAVIQGYFIGKAKFNAKNKRLLIINGWVIAIVVHGFYDFFILQRAFGNLLILALVTLSISIYFAMQLIQEHQNQSPFKKE
ncbi:MAG: PrsW family glutamic-type intramembrane protease [Bacteroidota bacterium]